MLQENKKINFFEMIIDLMFIAFFAARYLLPSFSLNFLIPLGLALAYGFYLFVKISDLRATIILSFSLMVFLAVVYAALTDTKTISSAVDYAELKQFFSKLNQYVMMFFPVLLAYKITKSYSKKINLYVIVVVSVIFLYVFGVTFVEILRNPGAVRHWGDFSYLDALNIGSYDFVYAIPILICVFATFNRWSDQKGKIISLLSIVISFIFLIFSDYTLAVLIAVIGVISVVFCSLNESRTRLKFVVIIMVGSLFVPITLRLIYTYLPAGDITIRFKEIYDFLLSGNADGYNLNSRLTLYSKSLMAFLHNPIVGNQSLDFDGHGTFLTILSDTGMVGFIPMFGIMYFVRNLTSKILDKYDKVFTPIFFAFILIGVVNPIHGAYALSFVMWFVAPVFLDYFMNKENANNETPVEN